VVEIEHRMVWPSGSARATSAAPIEPEAPALFSMTTVFLGDEIAEGAREQVGLPVRRVAADHTDIPRRPHGLRRGPAREERHRGGCRTGSDEMTTIKFR
jgi:hypothetical protein